MSPALSPVFPTARLIKYKCFSFAAKLIKKLYAFRPAFRAVSGCPQLDINDVESFRFSNGLFYMPNQWIAEFNDPPTSKTDKVIMVSGLLCLIMVTCSINVYLFYQTEFFQHLYGTVHCRQAEAWLSGTSPAVYLINIKMSLSMLNYLQNQGTLTGNPRSGIMQCGIDNGS